MPTVSTRATHRVRSTVTASPLLGCSGIIWAVCLGAASCLNASLAAQTPVVDTPDIVDTPDKRSATEDEGSLALYLKDADLELTPLFKDERFPNIVVSKQGTLIASWGSKRIRVRRSTDGGRTWGPEILVADPGFQGGGVVVDEISGDLLVFVEDHHPPAKARMFRSRDDGVTWTAETLRLAPNSQGHIASLHMNEHGITLQGGKFAGRLLRPSRWYAGKNDRSLWPQHYTNAIYSDDRGQTWQSSEPFPAFGTGEAAIVQLSNGSLYYNSRRHWAPEGDNPRRRWTAHSSDGGRTWTDLSICEVLPDGPQDSNYGCMAGLDRLPVAGRDILLYSNCDSPAGRHHGTVWASFDGGKSWPVKRLLYTGAFAYSSLVAGRPGTPTAGLAYVHFEGGPKGGSAVARFSLSWVLGGEATGDGELPAWLRPATRK